MIQIMAFWEVMLCSLLDKEVLEESVASMSMAEGRGHKALQNVGTYLQNYAASDPRRS
jgi:hypothetical protein